MKLLLAILYPAIEIFLLVKVGQLVGGLATVALVFGTAGLGFWLIRVKCREGVAQITHDISGGGVPKQAIIDNLLVFFAGVLLILPGILTDIIGLFLLIPLVRKLLLAKAGSALYRYSSTPGSAFYSATTLFVYDDTSGGLRTATSEDEADMAFSGRAPGASVKNAAAPEDVVLDVPSRPVDAGGGLEGNAKSADQVDSSHAGSSRSS